MQLSNRGGVTNFEMNIHRNLYYNFILRLSLNLLFILTAAFCFNYSTAQAATSTCNLEGFEFFETSGGGGVTALNDITFAGGGPLVDWEGSQDLTANTGVSDSNDFSSGCPCGNANAVSCPDFNCNPDSSELVPAGTPLDTCGPETTGFRGIIDPNGDTDFGTCDQENLCTDAIPGSDCDDFITFRIRIDGIWNSGSS